jgi:hypothetical protein
MTVSAMHLSGVDPRRTQEMRASSERAAAARTAHVSPTASTSDSQQRARVGTAGDAAPVGRGLKRVDTLFDRRVSGAQQAVQFLDRLGAELQSVKAALSGRLGERRGELVSDSELAARIQRVSQLWSDRARATGGTLDSQLNPSEPGKATRKFIIGGLTLATIRSKAKETLYVAAGGRTQHAESVVIDPELPDEAIVKRLDRAFAPHGIRATLDKDGEIAFSVAESAWSATRDSLAIRGEGRRFPSGQFAPVRIAAMDAAIQPEQWATNDETTVRSTLRKVLDAQHAVRQARHDVNTALLDAGKRLQSRPNATSETGSSAEAEGQWSAEFVRTFQTLATRGDYESIAALAPSLNGLSRERVDALVRGSSQD